MRIAFMGAIANNMYVMAGAARRAGHEVVFVRDLEELHVMSQPFWQDVPLCVPSETLEAPLDDLRRLERSAGWEPPGWLVEPELGGRARASSRSGAAAAAFDVLARRHLTWAGALDILRDADVVVACGVAPTLLAWASGRPYFVWPHGADIRLAAGLERAGGVLERLRLAGVAWPLRTAFRSAAAIVTQDPNLIGGHLGNTADLVTGVPVCRLPWPVPLAARSARFERRRRLTALLGDVLPDVPIDVPVVTVPSRLDFHLKGHHRLLEALHRQKRGSLHLILTGWGADLARAREMAQQFGIESDVTFLPFVLSKPHLYELFAAGDLAVDQFEFGTYGAAAPEAMGQSSPVMMNIDAVAFRRRGWEPPPVLQARTSDEIGLVMSELEEGRLEAVAEESFRWACEHHSEGAMVSALHEVLSRCGGL